MNLQNKVVLITGATGGIGGAIAQILSKEGCQLILHSNAKEISNIENAFLVNADFSKKEEIEKMYDLISEKFGQINILINTVGVEFAGDDQLNTDDWRKLFDINLFGAVENVRNALRVMEEGVIVNFTSLAGVDGVVFPSSLAYSVAKSGLIKFSEWIAYTKAPNIRSFCITPGYTMTSMWDVFSDEQKEECKDLTLQKRFVKPEEVAQFTVDLVKNDAVTGGNYVIDGGLHLRELI